MLFRRFGFFTIMGLLFGVSGVSAADPDFVGKWAQGQDACKAGDSYTIQSNGFKDDLTGDDQCAFTKVSPLSRNSWTVMATCGAGEQITFKFEISGNSLSVSGGHQPHKWVRCAK